MDLLCSTATPCRPSLPAPGCNSLGWETRCDRLLAPEKPTELFTPLGKVNCSANGLTTRGLHHSHIKVLKHLSTVLYSAKASWKALEKLPDLQKYLHICLLVKSVSLQHGSPLGSVLTSGCVSQLLPEQRNMPAARSSALWLSTAP